MTRTLAVKLAVLGALVLLLCVPLAMVGDLVSERARYQDEARTDIARSWGGRQQIIGPVLVQTWQSVESVEVWDAERKTHVRREQRRHHRAATFPGTLKIDGEVVVERRYRGIHAVPVYVADLTLSGELAAPALPADALEPQQTLVLAVADARGLREAPALSWAGTEVAPEPGTADLLGSGVSVDLGAAGPGSTPFTARLLLGGSAGLDLAPLGDSTVITITSPWPHPRFTGGYLPETREVGAAGFEAAWRTSRYAATARTSVEGCIGGGQCALPLAELVSLELVDPVDVYALNDRSTKYGALFVLVVFGVFFVYEALKSLRIHPVQYALVGLAQALFFLLLLSLSEHVDFTLAYLLGASACLALLIFYVSYVLGSLRRAAGFAAVLTIIYAALYVMLRSEDHALLLGSVLLLAVLGATMVLTRHLDWYAFGEQLGARRAQRPADAPAE